VPIVDREDLSVEGRLRIAFSWPRIEALATKTLPFLVGEWLQPLGQSALVQSELPYPLNVMDKGQCVVVVGYGLQGLRSMIMMT
jgi:hypothetical protein